MPRNTILLRFFREGGSGSPVPPPLDPPMLIGPDKKNFLSLNCDYIFTYQFWVLKRTFLLRPTIHVCFSREISKIFFNYALFSSTSAILAMSTTLRNAET